jgi:hypothetical protein
VRTLRTWLPLALAWGILIHVGRPLLVATFHDLTRDLHRWQLEAMGGLTLLFLAALILSLALTGWMMGRARRAITRRRRHDHDE